MAVIPLVSTKSPTNEELIAKPPPPIMFPKKTQFYSRIASPCPIKCILTDTSTLPQSHFAFYETNPTDNLTLLLHLLCRHFDCSFS